ncbi:MAG: hypothetical protein OIF48_18635 [Silicimonas sp.]|nr:hypothetical protein [Silicimonas sp.]
MSRDSRFLLVTRVGPESLHKNWIGTSQTRNFDVFLSAYDPFVSRQEQDGVFFEHRAGYKVAGYGGFLTDHQDLWRSYDFIGFFDEDLETSTEAINAMFALCETGQFKIAQPALTPDSHFTYAALVQQKAWILRHVTFIEMMCPIFRCDVLERVAPLYHSGHETGIDIVWSQEVGAAPGDLAVLDAVPLRHTQPVAGRLEDNGFDRDTGYNAPIETVLREYGVPWTGCVPLSAVRRSGRVVTSRLAMIAAALPLFLAVPLQAPMGKRLRFVLVHLKHLAVSALGQIPRRQAVYETGSDP